MALDEHVERLIAQLGHDPCRMTQAHRPLAVAQQSLEEIVDRHVARSAGQYLFSPPHGLANQLDHRGGLAGAGRPVHQRHVACRQCKCHGQALSGIQPSFERCRFRRLVKLRWTMTQQHVAKLCQSISASAESPLERRPLALARDFIARQIEPPTFDVLRLVGQLRQCNRDRLGAAIVHHAAYRDLGVVHGGEHHRAAHTQPRPGKWLAAAFGQLDEIPSAESSFFVEDHQIDQRMAGAFGLGG